MADMVEKTRNIIAGMAVASFTAAASAAAPGEDTVSEPVAPAPVAGVFWTVLEMAGPDAAARTLKGIPQESLSLEPTPLNDSMAAQCYRKSMPDEGRFSLKTDDKSFDVRRGDFVLPPRLDADVRGAVMSQCFNTYGAPPPSSADSGSLLDQIRRAGDVLGRLKLGVDTMADKMRIPKIPVPEIKDIKFTPGSRF